MSPLSLLALVLAAASLAFSWWKKIPIVMGIVITNVLVFVMAFATGQGRVDTLASVITIEWAMRLRYIVDPDPVGLSTIVLSTFLHADIVHLFGNMLVLLLLGLPFEERVGRKRFVAIYFSSAVVAVLLHSYWIFQTGTSDDWDVPIVGASGAVFGIMGAFAATYPRDRVPVIIPPFLFPIRMPVVLAAIAFMAVELAALLLTAAGGIAHAAHIGGAVGGVAFGMLLKPSHRFDPHGRPRPIEIDYAALDQLATTPAQRDLLSKLRANADQAETQRAWMDRLAATLRCPECGASYDGSKRGRLTCPQGHGVQYGK